MKQTLRFWLGTAAFLSLLLVLILWALSQWNLNSYSQQVTDRLVLLAELRRGAVEENFNTARAELRFWSINPEILEAQQQLVALQQGKEFAAQTQPKTVEGNPQPATSHPELKASGSAYGELHRTLHAQAHLFVTERGYYDFFLISPEGNVLYTVEKEADFATNLLTGPWKDTALAEVFVRAAAAREDGGIVLSDMRPYAPSDHAPAIFMATAMNSPRGENLGVIAFQLPTDRILKIMNYTSGMGETGETYLVGSDNLMRSNSRFSETSTVLTQSVDTPTVKQALAGEHGTAFVSDYRGVDVMSVSLPMTVGNTTWAVMAEIDRTEIEQRAAEDRPAFAIPLAFFYGLSLWSVWYWRNRKLPEADITEHASAMDFADMGDGPGLDV